MLKNIFWVLISPIINFDKWLTIQIADLMYNDSATKWANILLTNSLYPVWAVVYLASVDPNKTRENEFYNQEKLKSDLVLLWGLFATVYSIKFFTNRTRPYLRQLEKHWFLDRWFARSDSSFPSWHSAFSFFMASRIDYPKAHKKELYTLAGLYWFSRIYLKKHFLSDVVAGAGLGYLFGEILPKHLSKYNKDIKY